MTYHYSATGERIEDNETNIVRITPTEEQIEDNDMTVRDPEIVARCNDLRRILRESRARRQSAA